MGMYTKLELNVRLRPDTPQEVIHFMNVQCSGDWDEKDAITEKKPRHEFFECDRWGWIFFGQHDSFERPTGSFIAVDDGDHVILVIQCELKNYDGEIGKFLDWIKPYVVPNENPAGYKKYEEDDEPTLIYFKDEK